MFLAPEPKPLPAAALFKAYDEVLPQHGIDPDSDNHLSRLIFRVGGEQGPGSLIDKFQAILSRMGIVLEFGENSTVSVDPSESLPQSPEPSESSRISITKNRQESTNVPAPATSHDGFPASPSQSARFSQQIRRVHPSLNVRNDMRISSWASGQHHDLTKITEESPEKLERESIIQQQLNQPRPQALQRPALLSILDRWREASGESGPPTAAKSTAESEAKSEVPHASVQAPEVVGNEPGVSRLAWDRASTKVGDQQSEASSRPVIDKTRKVPDPFTSPRKLVTTPKHTPRPAVTEAEAQPLWERAARAREIYLASKTFNLWVEKTATRLEREAIARRHMIRFRCFHGWSRTPSSRAPAADHLRSLTAVQKLQRAVASHEAQLSNAALAIAQSHRLGRARRALGIWISDTAQHKARHQMTSRVRLNVLTWWSSQASQGDMLAGIGRRSGQCHSALGAIETWARKSRSESQHHEISKTIGQVRPMAICLEAWQEQTEIRRRADAYRIRSLQAKALHAISGWSLQAREQAYIWNSEYTSVTRVLELWRRKAAESRRTLSEANLHNERFCKLNFLSKMQRTQATGLHLRNYSSRASLFIMANKMLDVMHYEYERQVQMKKNETIQRLKAKYKEASGKRKRRLFSNALGHWRSAAKQREQLQIQASELRAQTDFRTAVRALDQWRNATAEEGELYSISGLYRINGWLNAWVDGVTRIEQRHLFAQDEWSRRQKHYCLKNWTKSSLQNGGQAHTAARVQQRYALEKRSQALQRWQQLATSLPPNTSRQMPIISRSEPRPAFRQAWTSARPQNKSRFHSNQGTPLGPMETPTRWTGSALPMNKSIISRPMPALRETDEQLSSSSSVVGDEEEVVMRHDTLTPRPLRWQTTQSSILRSTPLSSTTTPRAPVPSHFRPASGAQGGSVSNRATPISTQDTPIPAKPWSGGSRLGAVPGASSATSVSRWQSASFMTSNLANMGNAVTPVQPRLRDISVEDPSKSPPVTGDQNRPDWPATADRYKPPRSRPTTLSQSENAYGRSPRQAQ